MERRHEWTIVICAMLMCTIGWLGAPRPASAAGIDYDYTISCAGTCPTGLCTVCMNICPSGDKQDLIDECDELLNDTDGFDECPTRDLDLQGEDCAPPEESGCEGDPELDNKLTCRFIAS